jgi:transposase
MTVLDVLRDLMLGGRHCRRTVARMGVSLPTADRWLKALEETVPGVERVKVGKVAWLEWKAPRR